MLEAGVTPAKLLQWELLAYKDHFDSIPMLIPHRTDAVEWKGYISKFKDRYSNLAKMLHIPVFRSICLQLCQQLVPDQGFVSTAVQNVRVQALMQDVVNSLKALAQALLCFTEPDITNMLIDILKDKAPVNQKKTVEAVRDVWVSLLVASHHTDLHLIVKAISDQIARSTWKTSCGIELPTQEQFFGDNVAKISHINLAKQSLSDSVPIRRDDTMANPTAFWQTYDLSNPYNKEPNSAAKFVGTEWEKPVREGELECLLQLVYCLALLLDRLVGRCPRSLRSGLAVPCTEWPRLFANWKLSMLSALLVIAYARRVIG